VKSINYNLKPNEFTFGADLNEELRSCYENFAEIGGGFSNKVDKEEGKSLVADTEIAKIHAQGSDDQDLSGLVTKDQTTPQTFTGGIPLLESTHAEFSDPHQLIDKEYADRVQSGGMKSFFFTKTASDVATMYKADPVIPLGGVQTITGTATEGETIIAQFITDVATIDMRFIEGSRFFYITAKASTISKPSQLKCYTYLTDIAGENPVLVRTSTITTLLTTLDAEYIMSVWGSSIIVPTTNRIKFVIVAVKSGGGADPVITLSVEDDTFSRLDAPSPTGITDLSGVVPYIGATKDVNLGAFALAATEDLVLKTGINKTVVLEQPVYKDEYPAYLTNAGAQAAPGFVDVTIGGVARRMEGFDGGTIEERKSGSFEISHEMLIALPPTPSDVRPEIHVHVRPSTTALGTFIFYFDWEYSPPNAAPIPQATISGTYTITSNKQYWHLLLSLGLLPDLNYTVGGKIGFNLRRTPTTDTYPDDVLFEQVAMHIPCDTSGSRQRYIK